MKMNYKIMSGVLLAGAVLVLGGCGDTKQDDLAQLQEIVDNNEANLSTPTRPPEINGVITAVEGNTVTIKNEIGRKPLTEEEQAKRREERQKMSPEERRALREQETANLKTEDVVIEIPVGAVMVKGSGKADGKNVKASFDDMKVGAYVSVWMNGNKVEAVKIKGV